MVPLFHSVMIVGITGTLAAGKGEVSQYLVSKGFKHYSARQYLTEQLKKEGKEVNRDNLVALGNKLREENSPSYIAEQLFEQAKADGGDAIIESLRTPAEVNALREKGDFILLAINANRKLRYDRAFRRQSETDLINYEQFKEGEQKEMSNVDPNKQNLLACMKMADQVLINEGTLADLQENVARALNKIKVIKDVSLEGSGYVRPTWDEYFMEVCRAIAKRATCDRGRSGCVIAKNNQLLVSGYVGSPAGMPHCDEVGHQMKRVLHDDEDGAESNHCVRTVHAEQNAICQAAKHGVALEGATLYCKMTPCRVCAMLIVNCGISRVVCEKKYHRGAEDILKDAGVQLHFFEEEIETYDKQ